MSNYKHFLEVDYIVLIEGKSDAPYWQMLFETYRPDMKVEFQKRDGVENLKEIADAIVAGDIVNTIVCRDADYDVVQGVAANHDRVIHTYGYSFENDFICPSSAAAVVALLSEVPVSKPLVERSFRRYLRVLSKVAERLLALDVIYNINETNLIQRTNPRHLMSTGPSGELTFSLKDVNQKIRQVRANKGSSKMPTVPLNCVGPLFPRYYCGHSMFFVALEWCKRAVRRIAKSLPNASNMLIKNFLFSHYVNVASPEARTYISSRLRVI